jgi:hypothetical protein
MKMMQLIHAEGGVAAAVCVHAVMATMNLMTHSVTLSAQLMWQHISRSAGIVDPSSIILTHIPFMS